MSSLQKQHLHYKRDLTSVLTKYMDKDKLPIAREEINKLLLERLIGEDLEPVDMGGELMPFDEVNSYKYELREIITGKRAV